jgi:hypothetical protein
VAGQVDREVVGRMGSIGCREDVTLLFCGHRKTVVSFRHEMLGRGLLLCDSGDHLGAERRVSVVGAGDRR